MKHHAARVVIGTPIALAVAGGLLVWGPTWLPEATLVAAFVALAYAVGTVAA